MYMGKGGAVKRDKFKCLKLIKQVIRVFACVFSELIRQRVEINVMQCIFMSGHCGTIDAIFISSQLQKSHLTSYKPFYKAFINIEK